MLALPHGAAPTAGMAFAPPTPTTPCVPTLWKYRDVRSYVMEAGELISAAEAERQLARHRNAPIKTDLRGRRGMLAEGEANVDWDKELAMPEFEPPKDTLLAEQGDAAGARLQGAQTTGAAVSLDARRLQSGLRKLERLEERPRTLLKGLLKQDSSHTAQDMELAPW